ncbi:MAG: molybdate ABC transporter substrate-binding protein [Epsilonproteobacteria bacterium]|nr:molybdate ABC transporter substrate-binding protein [Campylobacterota bacterium]
MRAIVALVLGAIWSFGASITVAAAANMSFALPKLIEAFEKSHPKIEIKAIYASSGKLAAQIQKGAPYHIFLSADMEYPKRLYRQGLTTIRPLVYAKGKLVFLSRHIQNFQDVPKLASIAIANPKTAPYGKAAKEALERMGVWEELQARLIFGESVAQTFFYATKAAQGGFVAESALFGPEGKKLRKMALEVPKELYRPIEQGGVILKGAPKEAMEFFCFLFSPQGVEILESFGYRCDD